MSTSTVTLADVARHAGVSTMTVSNVINNRPGAAEATKRKVLEAVAATGYVVNVAGRNLAGGRTNTLGLLVPDVSSEYIGEIIRGASDEAEQADFDLLISTTSHRSRERERMRSFGRGLADGLLLITPRGTDALDELERSGLPVVVVDKLDKDVRLPAVSVDDYRGARLATEHLIGLGHRRIAFVAGRAGLGAADRLRGYREALLTAGLPFDEQLVRPGEFKQPGGFVAVHQLLALPEPPTAVFAANDEMAFGALDAVKDRRLRVPDDVSVVGFDDIPRAAQVHPALTTVRQPLHELGRASVRILISLIGGIRPPTERILLPTELVVRASTAPLDGH